MLNKLIEFLISILDLFRFWEVIEDGEWGLRFTFGVAGKDFAPGIHWKAPFNVQEYITFSTKIDSTELEEQTLTSLDGVVMTVQGYLKYRVLPAKAYEFVVELDEGSALFDFGRAAVAKVVEENKHDVPAAVFEEQVLTAVRSHLNRFGYKFLAFGLTQRAPTRTYRIIGMQTGGGSG
jgi:regulator of protease activity HflC (stomatin/prohibitin superfamily)